MKDQLESGKPFKWEKAGLLFEPAMPGFTHGSHPCAIHFKDDIFVVAFTCRDEVRRSHVFLSYATVSDKGVQLTGTPKLAMAPGPAGTFDCDGVISVCLIKHQDRHYLYYVGWQNLPEGMWICDTGRAILDTENLTLTKEFPGPVLGRDKHNPLFAAGTAFHITDDVWHTWYNSGISGKKLKTDGVIITAFITRSPRTASIGSAIPDFACLLQTSMNMPSGVQAFTTKMEFISCGLRIEQPRTSQPIASDLLLHAMV